MAASTAFEATVSHGEEEAFLWATSSVAEARRQGRAKTAALLEAVVGELAFGLGAAGFPPAGSRAARIRCRRGPGASPP